LSLRRPRGKPVTGETDWDADMYRREFLGGASAAALALALDPRAAWAQGGADAALYALMDRIFYGGLQLNPLTATSMGLDTGERAGLRSKLDGYGEAARQAQRSFDRASLASLQAVPATGLSSKAQLHRNIEIYLLERALAGARFDIGSVQRPYAITQQSGAYFDIPDSLDSVHPVETAADAEAYLARLAAFRSALDDNSALQEAQAARGYVAPGWSLDLALGQLRRLREPAPEQSSMVRSLVRRTTEKAIPGDWQARAARIVGQDIYPAVDRQIALLTRLRPTTKPGDGVWRVPDGAELYAEALKTGTTTNMTAEEVHKVGLEQVADLQSRLDAVLRGAGYTQGSIAQRLTALNTSPDQLFPDSDAGRAALIASLNAGIAAMKPKLSRVFADLPDRPLEIRRVPVEIQDGASNGYYYRAPLDGSRPAIYWINLKEVADWPKYQLPALTYHEGMPGHHTQLSYAATSGQIPLLLRNVFISAYGEGWALYAEQLADELGGYAGLDRAGALQSWLFRAARLVVDTGIHAKRWSREQATDYMVETTGFTRPRSQREVERYCTLPGQACSYKIGQNTWVKLRERAQTKLGPKFDLTWFHDVLKDGLMPLAMLEQRVDERIAQRLRS
jgi:uncharacterized protein (DUF885 family)